MDRTSGYPETVRLVVGMKSFAFAALVLDPATGTYAYVTGTQAGAKNWHDRKWFEHEILARI